MKDDFIKKLEENEDDTLVRMCFADWLEENGEPEEADRHRKWNAAKAKLMELIVEGNSDRDEMQFTYDYLVNAAREALASDSSISCGDNETMRLVLGQNYTKFWRSWSIVTGVPLPDPDANTCPGFRCAC